MAGKPRRRERQGLDPHPARTAAKARTSTPVHDAAERRARGYRWEDFRVGNYVGLKHGAYSERVVAPLAAELVEYLCAEHPDLAAARYRFAVSRWARCEARAALLSLDLDRRLADGEEVEATERVRRELRAEERRAREEATELGLSPASHARLELARADAVAANFDLGAALAEGRKVVALRAPSGPGGDAA